MYYEFATMFGARLRPRGNNSVSRDVYRAEIRHLGCMPVPGGARPKEQPNYEERQKKTGRIGRLSELLCGFWPA